MVGISTLITSKIGNGWITNLTELEKLLPYAEDKKFQKQFMATIARYAILICPSAIIAISLIF